MHKSAEFDISCPLTLAYAKNEIVNSVLWLIFGSFHQGKEHKIEEITVHSFSFVTKRNKSLAKLTNFDNYSHLPINLVIKDVRT